ncbi:MAG: hypothetical protein JWR26_2334 [Pedosphaera sp.]|nr:hypothetical protein [Pedosphaera sp.]
MRSEDFWSLGCVSARSQAAGGHAPSPKLRPKTKNLRSLAEELNLGLDSFIFLDDHPMECAEVEANCPRVLALQMPENLAEWDRFLQHVWAFDHLKVTTEDRRRTAMYQQDRLRRQFQSEVGSLADFLARLNLEVIIEPARPEHLSRVAELTQRTNQFNCAAQHCTEEEILKLYGEQGRTMLVLTVSDRFGDYGLVGVMIYGVDAEALAVETFLLSCRVLGKGVEHQMLARLGQIAERHGAARVDVLFRPTGRNQPALDF